MANLKNAAKNLTDQLVFNTKVGQEVVDNESISNEVRKFIESNKLPRANSILAKVKLSFISTEKNLTERVIDRNSEDFKALANSIRSEGLQQQPQVYVNGDRFECVVGRHRIEAYRYLRAEYLKAPMENEESFEKIEVCVLPKTFVAEKLSDKMFMENYHRKANSTLTIAHWIGEKSKENQSNSEIGFRLGKDREWVRRYVLISTWPESCKKLIRENETILHQTLLHSIARKKAMSEPELLSQLKKYIGKDKKRSGATSKENKSDLKLKQMYQDHPKLLNNKKDIETALKYFGIL